MMGAFKAPSLADFIKKESKALTKNKKTALVRRYYNFNKSMMYAIQAITGEKTHDIFTTLVSKADELLASKKIDVEAVRNSYNWGGSYYDKDSVREYIFYPNTKLYLGIYVNVDGINDYEDAKNTSHYSKTINFNRVTYDFKLPTSSIKMDDQKFNDLTVDAVLIDFSESVEEPKLKNPLTYDEREALALEKRKIKQQEQANKKLKKP